ncbi:MAG: exosortase F system-associated protein [Cyclobacteriaceae bacterium]|nr:exosortase F system-associated protein [Cyclobacteriaceae bacterium]
MIGILRKKYVLLFCCFAFLGLVYISQQFNYLEIMAHSLGIESQHWHPYTFFIFNKFFRFFLNDSTMVVVIWLLWENKSYVKLALGIEVLGLLVLLPLYFILKLNMEGDSEISSPLLSFIHRLIINPTLLIMLIPALYYQERLAKIEAEKRK